MFFEIKNKKINKKQIFVALFFALCLFLILGKNTQAQIVYTPQTTDLAGPSITFGNSTKPLGEFIKKVYTYGVGITAILATVVLMIGGFQWIIAGGSGEKIGEAKAWITASLSGLVLALCSYMILNLVNPALVNFIVKSIKVIEEIKEPEPTFTSSGGGQIMTVNFNTYDRQLNFAAKEANVDCNLLKAIMYAESTGNPNATGPLRKGEKAQGLMQVLPSTTNWLKVSGDLKNPSAGLLAGAKYVKWLQSYGCNNAKTQKYSSGFGNVCNVDNIRYVIAAYNGGQGSNAPDKKCKNQTQWQCLENEGFAETRAYVNKVLTNLNNINLNGWGCK